MGHEIGQFDIPDRQLLAASAQASMWSDIGEAKITHTIFGKPRVRVIREKDKILRAWLLGALAVIVIAAAAWQGWVALRHSKLFAVLPPLSERISIGPPVYQHEIIAPASPRSSGKGKPESVIQTEIDSLVASPNTLPPRPPPLNAAKPMIAKPVTAQPLAASKPQPIKPQTAPLATNNGASTNQTGTQSHPRPSAPIQPAVPAVAIHPAQPATPAVATTPATHPAAPAVSTPLATQPAASKPAPVIAPVEPSSKKDTTAPSSAGNNQLPGQTSVQPQANAKTQVNARGTEIIFVQPQDDAKP